MVKHSVFTDACPAIEPELQNAYFSIHATKAAFMREQRVWFTIYLMLVAQIPSNYSEPLPPAHQPLVHLEACSKAKAFMRKWWVWFASHVTLVTQIPSDYSDPLLPPAHHLLKWSVQNVPSKLPAKMTMGMSEVCVMRCMSKIIMVWLEMVVSAMRFHMLEVSASISRCTRIFKQLHNRHL